MNGLPAGRNCLWLLAAAVLAGCSRNHESIRPVTSAAAPHQTSQSCRDCHETQFAAWQPTDHALANRRVAAAADVAALAGLARLDPGAKPDLILGHRPLWQPLVPADGGRWQAHELAYDPRRGEWFNVFGAENRRPGEWGHWTGRGMNWNSMCAHCHMTGFRRGYELTADRYRSSWIEHGVGCIQCHGPTTVDHGRSPEPAAPAKRSPPFFGDRQRMMQTCAPCHARNERLTEEFQPGDLYADHYRLALPTEAAVFYPDGQQRDEDFNWTSVQLSRMGHAGVTCLDCHDPHSLKTILPASDNQLCLQCHAAPGRVLVGGTRAVPIDPVAHSRHQAGSTGNSCVACHMPTTTYMQRAPRHDHGWLRPDPLLTKELGIPNACGRCHADRSVDWAIAKADEWYGPKMDSRQRARARAVAAAQAGRSDAADGLFALLHDEDIPAWRATYLTLLSSLPATDAGREFARRSLQGADPLERAAAVRYLANVAEEPSELTPLLRDPVRLVRLEAEDALSRALAAGSPERRELDAYLHLGLDHPVGRMRLGQDLARRGDAVGAEQEFSRAVSWDPDSPALREAHGFALAGLDRGAEAAAEFARAAEILGSRGGPDALRAGLAYAQAGKWAEAEAALRRAVQLDPGLHRAWYNLGLLAAQQEHLTEAASALARAEALAPQEPDYPYALATVLLREGDLAGARAAATRARQLAPDNAAVRQLLRGIP